jgi:NAD(P)-dependent dehydrogenase (short-subunit alcohol dehydrogenase family)
MAIATHNPSLLILASRTTANISAVMSKIQAAHPSVPLRALNLDLASAFSIRQAATELLAYDEPSIDVLINNAGIMDLRPTRSLTTDGFEQHLAINHLGSFLFTSLILPKIRAAHQGRIVVVASNATVISPFRFSDINVEKGATDVPDSEQPNLAMLQSLQIPTDTEYISWVAYGASKTGSILTAVKWADILKKDGITVLSLHPGGKRRTCCGAKPL